MSKQTIFVTLSVCTTVIATAAILASAGPLTPPPGPVASTDKTLAEVEPRVAVNAANTPGDNDASPSLFKITQPGSYYLTGNVSGVVGMRGIEIAASGVTLDLNGFEFRGVPGSFDGVVVTASVNNVRIHNGSVRGWGGDGLNAGLANNAILRDLTSSDNSGSGLRIGAGGVVKNCTAGSNGVDGIIASISCTISGCTASFNTDDGIFASSGSAVIGCTVSSNISDGIQVSNDSLVVGNTCDGNGAGVGDGAGIHATSGDTRVEGNIVTDNDRGIDANLAGNLIIRNSAAGNATNYDIAANNKVGPIVNAPNSVAISGSTGGAGVGSTNPWANFSF